MAQRGRLAVLIRGTGDVASAVAVVLVGAGYSVALHDEPAPATTRRGMAFADAIFEGSATVEGTFARRVESAADIRRVLELGEIPVAVIRFDAFLQATAWHAIIDARMRKRIVPEHQRGMAALTIGLGPNFVAGDNVDVAIETSWGDQLGEIINAGSTLPLGGEPQRIGGAGRERNIYAPLSGCFKTSAQIGDHVKQGAVVASIAGVLLRAPMNGVIRGLTHDGVNVTERTKVIEIDPRGDPRGVFGLGERPKRIAEGVLRALRQRQWRLQQAPLSWV